MYILWDNIALSSTKWVQSHSWSSKRRGKMIVIIRSIRLKKWEFGFASVNSSIYREFHIFRYNQIFGVTLLFNFSRKLRDIAQNSFFSQQKSDNNKCWICFANFPVCCTLFRFSFLGANLFQLTIDCNNIWFVFWFVLCHSRDTFFIDLVFFLTKEMLVKVCLK
jgi:hypothetical protein